MIICSFDWELASKFIPLVTPIVALWIFKQWNKQKGSEVISNESKELWYNLDTLEEIYSNLENSYNSVPKKFYSTVDEWIKLNNKQIKLIIKLFEKYDRDTIKIDSLLKTLSNEIKDYESKTIFRNIRQDGVSIYETVNQEAVIELINSLKIELSNFILYKE